MTVILLDSVASARAAHCRYVDDAGPGIRRRRRGKGFSYVAVDGSRVTDADALARLRSLVIPPAWTDVWICPSQDGHIQATGRDARGRKQYRYHPRFREIRDENKYARMIDFAEALPGVRARIDEDLRRHDVSRARVLATVVRLLEITLIRIGNEEYARDNGSFGLTTMRSRHVDVAGATITFKFRGKSGKDHVVRVDDRRLARIVTRCHDLPGEALFQYEDGDLKTIESTDVNAYLHDVAGEGFTAKDFRTWAGTVLVAEALSACEGNAPHAVAQAVKAVARRLGNTPAVCRRCYVHPDVVDAFLDGSLKPAMSRPSKPSPSPTSLSEVESSVLRLLKRRSRPLQKSA